MKKNTHSENSENSENSVALLKDFEGAGGFDLDN
jgi:hypothetical protein